MTDYFGNDFCIPTFHVAQREGLRPQCALTGAGTCACGCTPAKPCRLRGCPHERTAVPIERTG